MRRHSRFTRETSANERRPWSLWKKKQVPQATEDGGHRLERRDRVLKEENHRSPLAKIFHIGKNRAKPKCVTESEWSPLIETATETEYPRHLSEDSFVIRAVLEFIQLNEVLSNRAVSQTWKRTISLPVNRQTDTFDRPEDEDEKDAEDFVKRDALQLSQDVYGFPPTPRQIKTAIVDTSSDAWWLLRQFERNLGSRFEQDAEEEHSVDSTLENFVFWIDLRLRELWRKLPFKVAYAAVPRRQDCYRWLVAQVYGCAVRPLEVKRMPTAAIAGQVRNLEFGNEEISGGAPHDKTDRSNNHVDHIVNGLWIGNAICLENLDACNLLGAQGITHVVSCYQRDFTQTTDWMRVHFVGLYDMLSANVLKKMMPAFRFIDFALSHKQQVLVHCHRGKSRSASIVIGYLMWRYGFRFEEALILAKTKRNRVYPNISFQAQLTIFDRYLQNHGTLPPLVLHRHLKRIKPRRMHMQIFTLLWQNINRIGCLVETLYAMTEEERAMLPCDDIWDKQYATMGVFFGFDVETLSLSDTQAKLQIHEHKSGDGAANTSQAAEWNEGPTKQVLDLESLPVRQGGPLMTAGERQSVTHKTYRKIIANLKPTNELPPWTHARVAGQQSEDSGSIPCELESYQTVLDSWENVLLCGPTGAGKTNAVSLAILRAIGGRRKAENSVSRNEFKLAYTALMKSSLQRRTDSAYVAGAQLAESRLINKELDGARAETLQSNLIYLTPPLSDNGTLQETNAAQFTPGSRTDEFSIFVKSPAGKTITIVVKPTDTVDDLKFKVAQRTHIFPLDQRLVYGAKQMEEDNDLRTYNLSRESTLHLLLRLRGGMPSGNNPTAKSVFVGAMCGELGELRQLHDPRRPAEKPVNPIAVITNWTFDLKTPLSVFVAALVEGCFPTFDDAIFFQGIMPMVAMEGRTMGLLRSLGTILDGYKPSTVYSCCDDREVGYEEVDSTSWSQQSNKLASVGEKVVMMLVNNPEKIDLTQETGGKPLMRLENVVEWLSLKCGPSEGEGWEDWWKQELGHSFYEPSITAIWEFVLWLVGSAPLDRDTILCRIQVYLDVTQSVDYPDWQPYLSRGIDIAKQSTHNIIAALVNKVAQQEGKLPQDVEQDEPRLICERLDKLEHQTKMSVQKKTRLLAAAKSLGTSLGAGAGVRTPPPRDLPHFDHQFAALQLAGRRRWDPYSGHPGEQLSVDIGSAPYSAIGPISTARPESSHVTLRYNGKYAGARNEVGSARYENQGKSGGNQSIFS